MTLRCHPGQSSSDSPRIVVRKNCHSHARGSWRSNVMGPLTQVCEQTTACNVYNVPSFNRAIPPGGRSERLGGPPGWVLGTHGMIGPRDPRHGRPQCWPALHRSDSKRSAISTSTDRHSTHQGKGTTYLAVLVGVVRDARQQAGERHGDASTIRCSG